MSGGTAVGVLGTGPMGCGIATLLARAGHSVTIGTGHPNAPGLAALPPSVQIATFADAASHGVTFLAVVHRASRPLVTSLQGHLAGKVLIDVDNAWMPGDARAAGLSATLTEGRWMARLLPKSQVTRAFSHIDWDLLVPSATNAPGRWAAGYTADHESARQVTAELILDMGYVPVLVGDLDEPAIDVGGSLWPGMFTPDQMRSALKQSRGQWRRRHL